ncbi:MAG: hypothetical protein OEN20_06150 [Gammaproteobacteria bacterium]|nr:hypothetical protein [Gammaproteobacteria bacterium]
MRAISSLAIASVFALSCAPVISAPSADEVRNVLSYYYSGSEATPVLVEFKLCEDVHREGIDKNNCKNEIDQHSLEVGESVYAWMNFIVPREERGEILMQFKHNGVIRGARKANVHGAIRYRTWRKVQFSRAGEWEIPILYDNALDVSEIDTVRLTVNDPLVTRVYPDAEQE